MDAPGTYQWTAHDWGSSYRMDGYRSDIVKKLKH